MDDLTGTASAPIAAQNGPNNSGGRTGPRTEEGKLRSSRNAMRHGVLATMLVTEEPFRESTKDYNVLLQCLLERYPCPDAIERVHIEQMALDYVRMARAYKLDARTFPAVSRRLQNTLSDEGPDVVTDVIDKESEVVVRRKELDPELPVRYQSNVRKSIEWHQERLEQLRQAREAGKENREERPARLKSAQVRSIE
jgi:hypothetical protein